MAYLITMPEKFVQADGTPFRVAQRDESNNVILRQAEDGTVLIASDGSALVEMEDADCKRIIRNFLNGIFKVSEQRKGLAIQNKKEVKPEHDLAMEDSGHALEIFGAMNASSNGTIELERAPYQWLLKMIDVWGIDLYGVNAAVLREVFKGAQDEGTNRAERHREAAHDEKANAN